MDAEDQRFLIITLLESALVESSQKARPSQTVSA
jgi:hypothetical protein